MRITGAITWTGVGLAGAWSMRMAAAPATTKDAAAIVLWTPTGCWAAAGLAGQWQLLRMPGVCWGACCLTIYNDLANSIATVAA